MQHPNVRAMFSDVYQLQSQMAKEQQEYMDALNRQEVAEKELKSRQDEYNALYAEVESLQKECEELQRIRAEREKKLDEIFDGKYGSDLEGQLEAETDLLTERKEIISRAQNFWSNAKVLMEHAVQQLAYSTRRWAQINTVNQSMVQVWKKYPPCYIISGYYFKTLLEMLHCFVHKS
jgi:DNA repair exonuclease SbcCD ATPase subunit